MSFKNGDGLHTWTMGERLARMNMGDTYSCSGRGGYLRHAPHSNLNAWDCDMQVRNCVRRAGRTAMFPGPGPSVSASVITMLAARGDQKQMRARSAGAASRAGSRSVSPQRGKSVSPQRPRRIRDDMSTPEMSYPRYDADLPGERTPSPPAFRNQSPDRSMAAKPRWVQSQIMQNQHGFYAGGSALGAIAGAETYAKNKRGYDISGADGSPTRYRTDGHQGVMSREPRQKNYAYESELRKGMRAWREMADRARDAPFRPGSGEAVGEMRALRHALLVKRPTAIKNHVDFRVDGDYADALPAQRERFVGLPGAQRRSIEKREELEESRRTRSYSPQKRGSRLLDYENKQKGPGKRNLDVAKVGYGTKADLIWGTTNYGETLDAQSYAPYDPSTGGRSVSPARNRPNSQQPRGRDRTPDRTPSRIQDRSPERTPAWARELSPKNPNTPQFSRDKPFTPPHRIGKENDQSDYMSPPTSDQIQDHLAVAAAAVTASDTLYEVLSYIKSRPHARFDSLQEDLAHIVEPAATQCGDKRLIGFCATVLGGGPIPQLDKAAEGLPAAPRTTPASMMVGGGAPPVPGGFQKRFSQRYYEEVDNKVVVYHPGDPN